MQDHSTDPIVVDYSQYQGPSREWDRFVLQNPLLLADLTTPPQTVRKATNALRVKIAEEELATEDLYSKATWTDHSILTRDQQNIVARIYKSRESERDSLQPIYLYFHGGGYLLGTIETEDAACARIAARSKVVVVNLNYRHTPEFRHPHQVNDAWDALLWLAQNATRVGGDLKRVFVGGISAGAALAASVVVRHHRDPVPGLTVRGQLLCIPWLIHPDIHPFSTEPTSSYQQNIDAPVLPRDLLRLFTDLHAAEDCASPELNVALTDDKKIRNLVKTCFLVAGQDLLRDEGLYFAEKLNKNGTPTKVHIFPGLPHGFRRFSALPSSKRWDQLLIEAVEWFLSEDIDSSWVVEST